MQVTGVNFTHFKANEVNTESLAGTQPIVQNVNIILKLMEKCNELATLDGSLITRSREKGTKEGKCDLFLILLLV